MQKFTLTLDMGATMRSPEQLADALRQVANKVQSGHGNGKIRDAWGDFRGEFDIVGSTGPTPQEQTAESILAAVAGTVFRSDAGELIVLLRDDPYAISVDSNGDTSSTNLVTVPPADIALAMGADVREVGGWSTGYDI